VQYLSGERRVPLARWWKVLRETPAVWWIAVLGLARAPQPEVLVRLVPGEPSPAGPAADGCPGLEEAYRRVADVLRRRRVTVLEVDARRVDPLEAARRIDGVCLDLARTRATPLP